MPWLKRLDVGKIRVTSLTDGKVRLDGGAMFGTVPRVLWERLTRPDERNRIPLRINPLLVEVEGKRLLIETGMADQGGAKFEEIYAVERDATVFDGLKALGLGPEDIDIVINTHLHFDHCGRNVRPDGSPTFRNAAYLVQRRELEDALHTHERNAASYRAETFVPLVEAGRFELLDGEAEIVPGVRVLPIPGHNLGQQAVVLESEGHGLVYAADLLPTFNHAAWAYIMGYDLYPVTTLETRKRHFPEWAERGFVIAPPHDPNHAFGKLEPAERGGYTRRPVDDPM
ncbi:MAG TPA: MBL fold metallo-hydrolase [Deinococcales bacterium]|nr:MBL fold metallo-hydrolase [Deinococcales bacterium]